MGKLFTLALFVSLVLSSSFTLSFGAGTLSPPRSPPPPHPSPPPPRPPPPSPPPPPFSPTYPPCVGTIASAPVINVYQQSDFALRPSMYDHLNIVQVMLQNDITLSSYLTFGLNYSCTVIRSAGQSVFTLSYPGVDQPGVVIANTHNLLWSRINIRLPLVTPTTPSCALSGTSTWKRSQTKYICPAMVVYASYAISVTKSRLDGPLDVVKTATSLFDSLKVLQPGSSEQSAAVAFTSVGWGPLGIKSGNVLSNSDISGGVGVYLAQKCTGVTVINNVVHDFSFSGISIGFGVHSIGDSNLNNVSYNKVYNPKSVVTSNYLNGDSAGIYIDTHWLGYGNSLTCNYISNHVGHCYYIDYDSSGVHINGGVCLRTSEGVKINGGKGNKVRGLITIGLKATPMTMSCQNDDTNNCNSDPGSKWAQVINTTYFSKKIQRSSPWIKDLCTAKSYNGYECNSADIRNSGYDTGGCSGVPTANLVSITNFPARHDRSHLSYRVFQCEKVPNLLHFNNFNVQSYYGVKRVGFVNVKTGDFGAESMQSKIRKIVGKHYVDCPKNLVGIQDVAEATYLANFNQPPPTWFFKYLPLATL